MVEKPLIKKSIFKQKVYRKTYEFKNYHIYNPRHHDYITAYADISENTELIKESEIHTCELEMPLLEVGEKFYIEELNKIVVIKERIRSSKDNVCYYLEPEIVEDEESKRTKELAENLKVKYYENKEEVERLQSRVDELQEFKKQVKQSFWFKLNKKLTQK